MWTNEFLVRGLDDQDYEKPYTAVAVTADRNQDGKIDFQDGAIAYRDDCYADESDKEIKGSEAVMNAYTSIAMNVGSAAQYPFLRILDNAKKFNLGTDGFQQMIIIKGYQGEGHDASHPDFANYNKRAGGWKILIHCCQRAKNTTPISEYISTTRKCIRKPASMRWMN